MNGQRGADHLFAVGEAPLGLPHAAERAQVDRHLAAAGAELAAEHAQRALVEPRGFHEASLALDQRRQRSDVCRDHRVVGAEQSGAQQSGAARVRFAARVAAARMLEPTEVVIERGCRVPARLVRPLHDRARAPVERRRVVEPPLVLAQHAEIVEHRGGVEIARAEPARRLAQHARERAIGAGVVSLRPLHAS